jgi:hypothetical protein
MRRLFSRKRTMLLGSLVAIAAVVGAVAYFTDSGTGTGQAKVGTSTPWSVTFGTTTGTMYPGSGTSTVPYTVTNAGSGNQQLTSTSASVVSDGSGNVKQSGTAVAGCLASWFTATNTPPASLPATVLPSGTKTGSVAVTMSDSGTNQDPCKNVLPDILVSAS